MNVANDLNYVMNPQRNTYEAEAFCPDRFHMIGIAIEQNIPKWIHHYFDDVSTIIFIVDLCHYNRIRFNGDVLENRLCQSVALTEANPNPEIWEG